MKRKYRDKEVHFNCLRCDHEWYAAPVTKVIRAPGRVELFGAQMQARGSRMSPHLGAHKKGGYEKQLEAMESRRDAAAAQMIGPTCPECGTTSVHSELVKKIK